ncbi:pentatricopeptide repeat-containing protein At3g21470-like [Actinidia eriantha]|uniref:pentatricopeptide repeat-containing protein At3g21470-like n=1 Tax=Actinidia eriantha TaxID=165200 RepID=UPI00258DBC7B|nr:pentatricopeptide repeat-containing protein At3g21470-like [Actinidia eriantha]
MPERDNITWSLMVNCYTQNGYYAESLQMFKDMYVQGFASKPELITSVLSACVRTGDFGVGRDIHALVVVNGWMEEPVFLLTALVDLYLRCHESLMAFQTDTSSFVGEDYDNRTLPTVPRHLLDDTSSTTTTSPAFVYDLNDDDELLDDDNTSSSIHGTCIRIGFVSDTIVGNFVVPMYCICKEFIEARNVFDEMPHRNVYTWNAIIAGLIAGLIVDLKYLIFNCWFDCK